mmetsp:Transcript_602/g.1013  ORF Transcript_602/g.1013 Transcript_602/m.1013 type:complete len:375 (+) Transcript_602:2884-4008(+)
MARIYFEGSQILESINSHKQSLKVACFEQSSQPQAVFAILHKFLPHSARVYDELSQIWPNCPQKAIAALMLFDLSRGKRITGGGALKRKLMSKARSQFTIVDRPEYKWCRFLKAVPPGAVADKDIPGLYRMPLDKLREVPANQVIIQDKASCMPVAALRIKRRRSEAIDACSAPGNKTLQIASRVRHVTAYERDPKRYDVLCKRLKTYNVRNVTPHNSDFLTATLPPHAKYIVVDPSCSCSGIVEHQLYDKGVVKYDPYFNDERVSNLAKMQLEILLKALSVPGASQVVYSTCSVHIQENEAVVRAALEHYKHKFRLLKALPNWKERGIKYEGIESAKLVRVRPGVLTGFFVALFGRKDLRLRHKLVSKRRLYY